MQRDPPVSGGEGGYNCSSSCHHYPGSNRTSNPGGRLHGSPDIYTFASAQAAVASMPKILENGRKVFGPPANWTGPRPSYHSELFLTHLPETLDEISFLVWLHRFGTVYELRLMMNSGHANRGYGFLRFSKESEALAALPMLGFQFQFGERLRVFRSQGKNRLFVSNIPVELPSATLEEGFKKIFPRLQEIKACVMRSPKSLVQQNSGYAFIEFYDHEEALEAKKRMTPGRVRMWNADLKVQWARPKVEQPSLQTVTLQAKAKNDMNDYNAKLRMFCMANDWCIPVVLYGNNFRKHGIQYGGVLLKSDITGEMCYIVMEVSVYNVYDIHLLMSEVAVLLIERAAGFPSSHVLLRVHRDHAEIVSTFNNSNNFLTHSELQFLHRDSIYDLIKTLQILSKYSSTALLSRYKNSFLKATEKSCIEFGDENSLKVYTILPKFRNNTPLKGNLNDIEINMMVGNKSADVPHSFYHSFDTCSRPMHKAPTNTLKLKSQHTNPHLNYVLRYVDTQQGCSFYHPSQQINTHPIWISGCTYQNSLYN